ncbi:MAG: 5'/3'-nucleotidase SurE, partial [Planctomycetota bacterium]|nr:5'/3'-nucleotidase SurE [Planctomycetota bacterium]
MRLLLTNDDGIEAEGLLRLEAALANAHDVWVVAPLANRSGVGHAITLDRPLRLHNCATADGRSRYAVDGT